MGVQAFGAELAVQRLDIRIVRWFAGSREVERHTLGIGPEIEVARDELHSLVDADGGRITRLRANPIERRDDIFGAVAKARIDHRGVARERVDHRQDSDLRAHSEQVVDKVHCPRLNWPGGISATLTQLRLYAALGRFVP